MPSPPAPTGRPSRRAKTAHKFIPPTRRKGAQTSKQNKAKAAPKIVATVDHPTKSPTPEADISPIVTTPEPTPECKDGPADEEILQNPSLEREQESEEDCSQAGDTPPCSLQKPTTRGEGAHNEPVRARTTGVTLRHQEQKHYAIENVEGEDDYELPPSDSSHDDDWEEQHQEEVEDDELPDLSDSSSQEEVKLSAVEKQIAMFRRRRLARTALHAADTVVQSPDPQPLFFPQSDEEVPNDDLRSNQPDETDDEDQCSGASNDKGKAVHRPGPLPREACQKAHELGDSVMKAVKELAVRYRKPVQCILEEAGLKKLATRAEQRWNLHQKWYAFSQPIDTGESVEEYRLRQKQHYETHGNEQEHVELWEEIREHGKAIVQEGDLSAKSLAALIQEAREQFAKGASAWSRLEGVEVMGIVVYKGHNGAARHAAGWFGGSTLVRDLINTHEVQLAKWLDYVTTVIKYKEIDSSATIPLPQFDVDEGQVSNVDHELDRGAMEGFRDWNRRIVPIMMGKKLKQFGCTDGKNIPWQSFDDLLYRHKLTITDWPAGVAAPPTWVPHDATVDELIAVVEPYLKRYSPNLHSRHIVPNASRRRFNKVKNKQPRLAVPDVELTVGRWLPEWCRWLENNDPRMFTIPLISDTESRRLCILRQCRKFLRDLPHEVTIPGEVEEDNLSVSSLSSHEPSPIAVRKKTKVIAKQPHRNLAEPHPIGASKSKLQPRKRHHDEEELLEEYSRRKHVRQDSQTKELHIQHVDRQMQSSAQPMRMQHRHVPPQQRAERHGSNNYYRPEGLENTDYHGAARLLDVRKPPLPAHRVARHEPVPVVRSRHHEPSQHQALARPPPLQAVYRSRSPTYARGTHVHHNPSPVAGPSRVQYIEVGSGDEYGGYSDSGRHDNYSSYYD